MIPKEMKYNLHYDDVREDFFTAATLHNTSYSRVKKGLPLETKKTQNHENRRLGLSLAWPAVVQLLVFIYSVSQQN